MWLVFFYDYCAYQFKCFRCFIYWKVNNKVNSKLNSVDIFGKQCWHFAPLIWCMWPGLMIQSFADWHIYSLRRKGNAESCTRITTACKTDFLHKDSIVWPFPSCSFKNSYLMLRMCLSQRGTLEQKTFFIWYQCYWGVFAENDWTILYTHTHCRNVSMPTTSPG